jgi:uncharacterized BrkB/YihY/UPF0761 family membrane protein
MPAILSWALFALLVFGFVMMLVDVGEETQKAREDAGKPEKSGYWGWIAIAGAVLLVVILAEKGL